MTFTVHGADGFLRLLAAACFLTAFIMAWAGHRLGLALACLGLLCWVLTALVR